MLPALPFQRTALTLALVLSSLAPAHSAAPVLEHLYPAGGQQGTTVNVTANGKFEPWPVEVWTDHPGLVFKADKDKGKFTVEVSKDVPVGPHLVRVYNADGASVPRFFLVNTHTEVLDKESNDSPRQAQALDQLPVIVNGRLERGGDVDGYAVKLQAGQWLVASVNAFTIYSTMDGLLRITDTNGFKLAFAHDSDTLDPFLAWQAKSNGTYVVQVMGFAHPATSSENLGGGANYIYRLSLTTGPYLRYAFPSTVQRGQKENLQLIGWNLTQSARTMSLDATALKAGRDEAVIHPKEAFNNLAIPLSDAPALRETEPNNAAEQAQKIAVPCSINGIFQEPGDVDRFVFEAKKDAKLEFEVEGASPGTPLDAWLRLLDHTGKELAKTGEREGGRRRSRDSGDAGSRLSWTAPADGTYSILLGNLLHKGGEDYVYRLDITSPKPGFAAKASAHTFSIAPGKTNEVKATVRLLNGFDHKLKLAAKNLPKGVSAEAVEVSDKGGDVTLKLVAADDAPPWNGVIQLAISDTKTSHDEILSADLTSGGIDNGVPQGFPTLVLERTDQLWLTVTPKPAPKEEKKEEKK
ncbi:MAG: PPC domain-containing protein [Verrucomicrobiota bacterium]